MKKPTLVNIQTMSNRHRKIKLNVSSNNTNDAVLLDGSRYPYFW